MDNVWKNNVCMCREPSPLSHAKMLKVKPIVSFLNSTFIGCARWKPPTTLNGYITSVHLFQGHKILVLVIEEFVAILQVNFDILFVVSIERLNIVKQTCSFFVNHYFTNISKSINNLDSIPIGMGIIYHESFEVGF